MFVNFISLEQFLSFYSGNRCCKLHNFQFLGVMKVNIGLQVYSLLTPDCMLITDFIFQISVLIYTCTLHIHFVLQAFSFIGKLDGALQQLRVPTSILLPTSDFGFTTDCL